MKPNLLIGYIAASIAAAAFTVGTLQRVSLLSYVALIVLGPATFGGMAMIAPWPTPALEFTAYYGLATVILGGCLWFMPETPGVGRRACQAAMALVWLVCAAYVFWLIGQG